MNWTAPEIIVCAVDPSCIEKANKLAQLAGLAAAKLTVPDATAANNELSPWTLLVKPAELSLVRPDGLSIEIDFIHGKGTQRSKEANFKSQPLARALGLQKLRNRKTDRPSIIDATAGFGTDGWMMASLDSDVRLLEASPVLATMLTHALNVVRDTNSAQYGSDNHLANSALRPENNLSVINTNCVQYLNDANNASADVIYLDPMYPQTRSSALVKKGMQLLHELIGPDDNGSALLSAALKRAEYRVVVKRPRGAPLLEGSEHFTGQITDVQSPHTRFDIYHNGGL